MGDEEPIEIKIPAINLVDGSVIPVIGLAIYKSNPDTVANAVKYAIDNGYRYFDCAWINGNDHVVGNAIAEKIRAGVVTREELFICTKVWNNFHEPGSVVQQLGYTLAGMGLTYVDLYLMHWPIAFRTDAKTCPLADRRAYSNIDYLETYKGMEDCVEIGYAKSLGVANFNSEQIHRLMTDERRYRPVVNQIEVHPWLDQRRLINLCRQYSIRTVGYCPLGLNINELSGTPGFPEPTITDPAIIQIGKRYKKTAAQVVLNYLVSHLEIIVVPKSLTNVRILEYAQSFDFTLNQQDLDYLDTYGASKMRLNLFGAFINHIYYPFNVEF